jgi:hypothetical protein
MGTVRALGEGGEPLSRPAPEAMRGMSMSHEGRGTGATRAQIGAVGVLSLLVLAVGILLAAGFGSFSM